jgi:hypothetical protein
MGLAAILSVDPFGERLRPGAGAGFVVVAAFLVSFLMIRTSARLTRSVSWWPGGVQTGGVHVHHLVWGIGLMLLCGFLAFAAPLEAPYWHLVAIGFGVGAGFTLDEFALWVRLEDVYWAEQGRASFDAVVCSLAFMKGRVLLGVIGLFVPVVALAGAVRLACPSSPWARWRYEDARRLRAEQRFAATRPAQRLRRRIGDVVAGKPSE